MAALTTSATFVQTNGDKVLVSEYFTLYKLIIYHILQYVYKKFFFPCVCLNSKQCVSVFGCLANFNDSKRRFDRDKACCLTYIVRVLVEYINGFQLKRHGWGSEKNGCISPVAGIPYEFIWLFYVVL